MALAALRREERIALAVAVAAHAGLLAVLLLRPAAPPPPREVRMSVTLSDAASPTETAPRQAPANADLAPTLGTAAPPPAPTPVVKPAAAPEPVPAPPPPRPRPVVKPRPAPVPPPPPPPIAKAHRPAPTPPPTVAPRAKPEARPERHATPDSDPIARAIAAEHDQPRPAKAAKPAHTASQNFADAFGNAPAKPKGPVGGNRIGADFLKGLSAANTTSRSNGAPAKSLGPEVRSALAGALARQLKPHWVAPQGVDADQLVTVLAFDLNPDGTLNGKPRVVAQRGIDDSNRPQAARHAEQAIRAVELAAPFTLPAEYYDAWKHVTAFQFDRKLSQ